MPDEPRASLALSSRAWLPARDRHGAARPLCAKHSPRLLAHLRRGGQTVTVWQCLLCGATYDVVAVGKEGRGQ